MTKPHPPQAPVFPSPQQVLGLIKAKLAETGLRPIEAYLDPRPAWDGEDLTLAWKVDLITLEAEPGPHCTHRAAVHSGPRGLSLSLGSGDYCLGSLDEARESLGLNYVGCRPSFVFDEKGA